MAFTNEQMERYSRHIILQEVGVKGQKKLLNGKVLIIGAGGLGAPAAMYLAAAGVGTIGIVDADEVDLSNLQRQIIHGTADIGKAKVKSAVWAKFAQTAAEEFYIIQKRSTGPFCRMHGMKKSRRRPVTPSSGFMISFFNFASILP